MEGSRVFTEGGTVAHLLDPLASPNSRDDALCGRSPWPAYWHGTGSQEEYDKAMDLRLCAVCQSVRRHRDGSVGAA